MTFTYVPTTPFLAARSEGPAQAQIVGLPFDPSASFRAGARFAPNAIREFSESIETYSPWQQRDLETLVLVDLGNLALEDPLRLFPDHLEALRGHCAALKTQAFTLFLGGEHTLTLGLLSPAEVADPDFFLLVLDAHLDLREAYQGSAYSHASWARRALEWLGPERMLIAGARSGTREEFALAEAQKLLVNTAEEALQRLHALERPNLRLHLSLDIDVLDPGVAPGTGNPEPCGWRVEEVLQLLRGLRDLRVVSADLVEYSPPHDPGGVTGIVAAWLVREMLLALA